MAIVGHLPDYLWRYPGKEAVAAKEGNMVSISHMPDKLYCYPWIEADIKNRLRGSAIHVEYVASLPDIYIDRLIAYLHNDPNWTFDEGKDAWLKSKFEE